MGRVLIIIIYLNSVRSTAPSCLDPFYDSCCIALIIDGLLLGSVDERSLWKIENKIKKIKIKISHPYHNDSQT
ncbi:hypothetical protein BDV40DRAFT_280589 [Aspergillus tamarii]|uniref:Uncharacterized protein n=1 Tax=Aspergillus tamarii TaxID=41984 RepID=A0A5N6UDN7_ASPTM|nr:hypothetical protein BDV40DRAFT_280589 [Aspergillus tamarii]